MGFLISAIPLWGRLLALAALAAAVWGHGFYTAHHRDAAKYDALQAEYSGFKGNLAALGKAAEAHTAEVTRQQEKANADISTDFKRQLAALRSRVQQRPDRADGSQIPVFSCGATGATGSPADAVPVESIPKADYDQLRADASVTTLMLVNWQEWYRQQAAAFRP